MSNLTLQQLMAIMPHLKQDKATLYLPHLNKAMADGAVNTPQRQAAFLAQGAHESAECRYFTEIWGPTPQQLKYEPPSGVAKMLGNTQPGDGAKFKGHGIFQITGRFNHTVCGKALGADFENHPELAATPEWAFQVGRWYWNSRKLNDLADIDTKTAFETITKRINGGQNGADQRWAYYQKARAALGLPPL